MPPMRSPRSLSDVIAGEPQLRYQGMPSDGDSRTVYGALGAEGLDRDPLAARARRPRPQLAAHAGLRGALRLPVAAAVGLSAVGQDDRQRAAAVRRRRAPGAAGPRGRRRAAALLPGLLRARRRLGSGLAANARPPRRRSVHRQRPQDLDLERRVRRLGLPGRPHRPRPRAPPRRSRCSWPTSTTPGITVTRHRTLGGGTIGELELDEVEIPAAQLVGELHGGWQVLMGTLDYERVTSEKVGTVFWLLDALAPLAADDRSRRALSRLRGAAQAARLHGRRAAQLLDAGRPGERPELDGEAVGRRADAARGRVRGRPARSRGAARGGHRPRSAVGSRRFSGPPWRRRSPAAPREIQRTVIARRELGIAAPMSDASARAAPGRDPRARVRPVRGRSVRRHAARRPRRRRDQGRAARRAMRGDATSRSPRARAATSTR